MKNYYLLLLLLLLTFGSISISAQNSSETIYQFEIKLSNSENSDYRQEQHAFLMQTLDAIKEQSYFDKARYVHIIKTTVNYNVQELVSNIEAKGITVVGTIVKSDNNPVLNTH